MQLLNQRNLRRGGRYPIVNLGRIIELRSHVYGIDVLIRLKVLHIIENRHEVWGALSPVLEIRRLRHKEIDGTRAFVSYTRRYGFYGN